MNEGTPGTERAEANIACPRLGYPGLASPHYGRIGVNGKIYLTIFYE
jgi:hypothetical protein